MDGFKINNQLFARIVKLPLSIKNLSISVNHSFYSKNIGLRG